MFLKISKKSTEKLDSFSSVNNKHEKKKTNLSEYQVNKYSKLLSQNSAKSLQKMKIKDSSVSDSSNSNVCFNKSDSIDFSTFKSSDLENFKKEIFSEAQDALKQEKLLAEFKKNIKLQEIELNILRRSIQTKTKGEKFYH